MSKTQKPMGVTGEEVALTRVVKMKGRGRRPLAPLPLREGAGRRGAAVRNR